MTSTPQHQHQTLQPEPTFRHQMFSEQTGNHWLDASNPSTILILVVLFGITFIAAALNGDG